MNEICERILHGDKGQFEHDTRPTVVAYGAANFTVFGKYSGPVEGIRRALRRRGEDMYLVNEAYTSKLCSSCHLELVPMFDETGHAIHAVRRCETDQSECKCRVWHRDVNACLNIMHLFNQEFVEGKRRPRVFTFAYQRQQPQQQH